MPNDQLMQKKLISFFSAHTEAQADSPDGKNDLIRIMGSSSWRDLLRVENFLKHFEPIKSLRIELDSSISGLPAIEQAQSCLALLKSKIDWDKMSEFTILTGLIQSSKSNCIYKQWSIKVQKNYTTGLEMISSWTDFFLSYTNRNLPATNNDFKDLILHNFRKNDYEKEKDHKNFLAKLIVKYLRNENLRPFFDQQDILCGDDLQENIRDHCQSCFVFVQLVEKQLFSDPDKGKNWCFWEYDTFNTWIKSHPSITKRFYFILPYNDNDLIFPAQTVAHYKTWQENIQNLNYTVIKIFDFNNLQIQKEMNTLAKEIIASKQNILHTYLGDYMD